MLVPFEEVPLDVRRRAGRATEGFIVVATGAHDVPVPHLSLDLAPPSRQLDELGTVDRVVVACSASAARWSLESA